MTVPEESATCDCRDGTGGYRYSQQLDLWVHANCGKPSQMYLDTVYERALEEEAHD